MDGQPVQLLGVANGRQDRAHAEQFLAYITQNTFQVRCEPSQDQDGFYECRAVKTDVRIAAGLIANGFAMADADAPAEYHHWEDDARQAHRGLWRR